MAMSALTNSVYTQCDIWYAFNQMAAYSIRQDKSLANIQRCHQDVVFYFKKFKELK